MAIGSNILHVDSTSGKVREVYNHMSTHLMYSGRVLYENYNTEEKVLNLLQNGDIYCLGLSTDPVPDDKANDEVYTNGTNHCVFFNRDKKDDRAIRNCRTHDSLESALKKLDANPKQFTYIFENGKWSYRFWKQRAEELNPIRIFHDDE